MVANSTQIQSRVNFLMNQVLFCYRRSQLCILVMRQQHTHSFSSFFRPTSLPASLEFVFSYVFVLPHSRFDCLCGLVVRVLGYRSVGPGSIPGTTRKKEVVGLERGPLSLVSTTEELLDRKVVAPV
jgi:hypothetical protein